MDTTRLKQGRRLFCHDLAPVKIQRHNLRQWVASLRKLGPRWRGLPGALPLNTGVLS